MSDERSTAPEHDDEDEVVLGANEPAPPSDHTPTASASSAPALQRRDAGGETS